MPASRFRLPADVRPLEYRLDLEPDLDAGTFRGRVEIGLRLARRRSSIILHAADLRIERVLASSADGETKARCTMKREDEAIVIRFARPLAAGEAKLRIDYSGRLGRQLRGLYAASSDGRRYAFTQLEAADARRVLPCFDEPCFKARFRVSVTAAKQHAVVSNSPVEHEEPASGGRRAVRFAPTPPLSSYLLALAVGPLEASAPRMLGSTPIRIWHVPGKSRLVDFGLEAAVESLRRLEEYFGLPYPYAKLDLVAVPDFEAGAMENAGAVFFRETLLLVDPATASLGERKRAAEVIAHELAHMWYGDLVTMAWWDDLWLNEAFATWMAYRVIDDWRPEWRMWQGYEHDRAGALALDALANTHPIYARVRSVAEATQNFDAITYEKGAAVVRMIEHYLGAEAFREGVRLYVRRHREGNAVADDLWRALEETSGRAVARVAQAWIEKAGFPLVTLRSSNGSLRVRQERFFADPRVPAERRRGVWPVPLVVKRATARSTKVDRVLVDAATKTIDLGAAADWVFGNADAAGFYRVRHAAENRAALLRELDRGLTPVERMALLGDQWALVRAARDGVESFLDVVDRLGAERDHDVVESLAAPLGLLDDQVLEPESEARRRFRAWIGARFSPAFEHLGWRAAAAEPDDVRLLRAALLQLVGLVAEAPGVIAEARRRLDEYLADRASLDANLADAVVALAARQGDEALYERYRGLVAESRTPHERRRFLLNLASFRTPATIDRTLAATLGPEVPTQDVAFLLMRLFHNPAARERAWSFFTKRWGALRKRIPPLMISRLVEATPALRSPKSAREVRSFFAAHPVPEAARALKQALEVFRLNADLRRRAAAPLAEWLAARTSA